MATRYDQFRKVRREYSHQLQLRTRVVTPTATAIASGTVLPRYDRYAIFTSRGSWRGGYSIP
jgi:hypothetical protein